MDNKGEEGSCNSSDREQQISECKDNIGVKNFNNGPKFHLINGRRLTPNLVFLDQNVLIKNHLMG